MTAPSTETNSLPRTRASVPGRRWYHRVFGLLFALACLEMGFFLIAFPWSSYWNSNYFSWLSQGWRELWVSPYFRGAISGLGVLNLYITLTEVFRLKDAAPAPSAGTESE